MARLALLLLLCLWPVPAAAKKAPITIKSDRMEVIEDRNLVVFTGHVVARKQDFTLHADRLIVYYRKGEGKREVEKLVAVGHVRLRQGEWVAAAGKAVYFRGEERVVLEDNPQVWQGENTIRGERIILYLNENRSVAESGPGQKAEVTIFEE